uniref:Zinc finger, CCHC-type n=1 Tax=Tanacetum cinerariifolium TaxID=118510 RepID=A0A6L2NNN0_TANCI|nr:zinc finger, CCHC-type [Tanacetum cinerariifolium]
MTNGEYVKDMTSKFDKLAKFEGQDFRRWQKKIHFLLTTLKVVYVLSTPSPVWFENETLETSRKRMKIVALVRAMMALVQVGLRILKSNKDDEVAWWVDSGATSYVCKDLRWFQVCKSIEDGSFVKMENIATEPIKGIWRVFIDFHFWKNFMFRNVLYVLGIRKNLVYEIVLNKCGYKQVLESDKYILSRHGSFVEFGYVCNGIIRLNLNYPLFNASACMITFSHSNSLSKSELWHVRLGHVHYKRMRDMSKMSLIPAFDMTHESCKTCMLTKITRQPFKGVNQESKVLDLVHSDLCDFYANHSLGHNKYVIIFIDDASRYCYVYLLHAKHEALDKFKIHKQEVELQRQDLIKVLHTDRGGEYYDQVYFQSTGVIHQTTAPYTPQQNGVAERKNMTLKEIVNSILSYFGPSEGFWGMIQPSSSKIAEDEVEGTRDKTLSQREYCFIIEEDPRTLSEAMTSKDKMKVEGSVDKYKARLVIQGFRQKERIDFFDTYAPVARIFTIRLLLALAAIHDLVIHQMDMKTAFLNDDLDEKIYMKQPEGFVMPGHESNVCKLKKLLYGLKQAPKQWHQKFDDVVLSNDFSLNQADKCVYSKFDASGKEVIICLFLDDMLIFGTNQDQVNKTKEFLSSKFDMKDLGVAEVILGIRIKRRNNGISISQSHYIEKILTKFNFANCSPVYTHVDLTVKFRHNKRTSVSQLEYSRAIGCLMYAMISTRSDITFVAGKLSRYTSNPSALHWQALDRVFQYLKETFNLGCKMETAAIMLLISSLIRVVSHSRGGKDINTLLPRFICFTLSRCVLLCPFLFFFVVMSGSKPDEMAPGSLQAVVLPKFDMHLHTLILTSGELKDVVNEYCIPGDLHPRLPSPALTMNKIPSRYIRLYIEQLEQGGVTSSFLYLFLAVIKYFGVYVSQLGHWFSFESKTGGHSKKCFKEITYSLKDVRDDFPTHFSESDAARLAEFVVPLRPPPRHLFDHSGRFIEAFSLDGNRCKEPIPEKSSFHKNLDKPNPKITAARNEEEPATAATFGSTGGATNVEKEVVDLSGNTRVPTSSATAVHSSPRLKHSASNGELVKRHKHLNHDYVDLRNHSGVYLMELDRLRNILQSEMQANGGLNKRLALLDTAHSLCSNRERELMDMLKDMEKERDD